MARPMVYCTVLTTVYDMAHSTGHQTKQFTHMVHTMARPTSQLASWCMPWGPMANPMDSFMVWDNPWRVPCCVSWVLPRCIPWHVSRDNRFRCVCMGLHGCTPWNGPCFWITHCVYHTVFHRKHHVFYHVPWDVSCIHHGVHHGTCHGILHGK